MTAAPVAGSKHRFGLMHVDFPTQQRTVKASGESCREVILSKGAALRD